jgi:hypothetical protein
MKFFVTNICLALSLAFACLVSWLARILFYCQMKIQVEKRWLIHIIFSYNASNVEVIYCEMNVEDDYI